MLLELSRQEDFELLPENRKYFDGCEWNVLARVGGEKPYQTFFKMGYSDSGLYFLFHCTDRKKSCSEMKDGDDLYTEDVLEIFLRPDSRYPVYLEYELSPLNKELVLMVSHNGELFYGWKPFHYEGGRKTRHITWSEKGALRPGRELMSWEAMCYLPFSLLEGIVPAAPVPGTVWTGNIFRIDYDGQDISRYGWDTSCGTEFHDYEKFGEIRFI